jgi:hypothetical protein
LRNLIQTRSSGTLRDGSHSGLRVAYNCLALLVIGHKNRLGQAPAADILEQTVVDRKVVEPTLALQDVEIDGVVSEYGSKF